MGIMVYSLLWVMQDFVHQPDHSSWLRLMVVWDVRLRLCLFSILDA